jgi:hypothetical protein
MVSNIKGREEFFGDPETRGEKNTENLTEYTQGRF